MIWHYSKSGVQADPVSQDELIRKIRNGEVLATDLVWRDGMPDWVAVAQVPELGAAAGAVSAAPVMQTSLGMGQKIPNYLWQSIAATVLCCMPFGVVAIVYAAKVDGLVAKGDLVGAQAASKAAKMWVNVSVGGFVLFFVVYLLFVVSVRM